MYYIRKSFDVFVTSSMSVIDDTMPGNIYLHSFHISIYCQAFSLNPDGMVIDFKKIRDCIKSKIDNKYLDDVLSVPSTMENLASWIAAQVGKTCYRVEISDNDENFVRYDTMPESSK